VQTCTSSSQKDFQACNVRLGLHHCPSCSEASTSLGCAATVFPGPPACRQPLILWDKRRSNKSPIINYIYTSMYVCMGLSIYPSIIHLSAIYLFYWLYFLWKAMINTMLLLLHKIYILLSGLLIWRPNKNESDRKWIKINIFISYYLPFLSWHSRQWFRQLSFLYAISIDSWVWTLNSRSLLFLELFGFKVRETVGLVLLGPQAMLWLPKLSTS
jgi:hypothetical protein